MSGFALARSSSETTCAQHHVDQINDCSKFGKENQQSRQRIIRRVARLFGAVVFRDELQHRALEVPVDRIRLVQTERNEFVLCKKGDDVLCKFQETNPAVQRRDNTGNGKRS